MCHYLPAESLDERISEFRDVNNVHLKAKVKEKSGKQYSIQNYYSVTPAEYACFVWWTHIYRMWRTLTMVTLIVTTADPGGLRDGKLRSRASSLAQSHVVFSKSV
jgi:hypothetical protein